jgi:hypothetical protein
LGTKVNNASPVNPLSLQIYNDNIQMSGIGEWLYKTGLKKVLKRGRRNVEKERFFPVPMSEKTISVATRHAV